MIKVKLFVGFTSLILFSLACGLTDTISSGAEQVATVAGKVESLATTAAEYVPQAALDDPRAYLVDALHRQMLTEPFRATMQSVSANSTQNYTVEFQPPDRYHLTIPGTLEGIVIGKIMYININGSWSEMQLTDDFKSAFGLLGPGGENIFGTISDVAVVGAELLDGKPTLIFSYAADATIAGIVSTSSNKLWLGATDGRVYQIVSEGEAGGIQSTTTGRYVYDPSIVINPP